MAPWTKHIASMGEKKRIEEIQRWWAGKSKKFFYSHHTKKGLIMFDSKTLHPFDNDITQVKMQTDTKSTSSVNSHLVLLSFIVARLQVLREVVLNIWALWYVISCNLFIWFKSHRREGLWHTVSIIALPEGYPISDHKLLCTNKSPTHSAQKYN